MRKVNHIRVLYAEDLSKKDGMNAPDLILSLSAPKLSQPTSYFSKWSSLEIGRDMFSDMGVVKPANPEKSV